MWIFVIFIEVPAARCGIDKPVSACEGALLGKSEGLSGVGAGVSVGAMSAVAVERGGALVCEATVFCAGRRQAIEAANKHRIAEMERE
ncbi:MAG: hypothetical protein B6D38_09005 [Anaerolineae bacterium UTCFX1]|nr:MAG: hypothetical protein B6D38_09005 [Anaerolineae bacterium UTCFX1]